MPRWTRRATSEVTARRPRVALLLAAEQPDPWRAAGPSGAAGVARLDIEYCGQRARVLAQRAPGDRYALERRRRSAQERTTSASLAPPATTSSMEHDGKTTSPARIRDPAGVEVIGGDGATTLAGHRRDRVRTEAPPPAGLTAPMPGLVLKVMARPGQKREGPPDAGRPGSDEDGAFDRGAPRRRRQGGPLQGGRPRHRGGQCSSSWSRRSETAMPRPRNDHRSRPARRPAERVAHIHLADKVRLIDALSGPACAASRRPRSSARRRSRRWPTPPRSMAAIERRAGSHIHRPRPQRGRRPQRHRRPRRRDLRRRLRQRGPQPGQRQPLRRRVPGGDPQRRGARRARPTSRGRRTSPPPSVALTKAPSSRPRVIEDRPRAAGDSARPRSRSATRSASATRARCASWSTRSPGRAGGRRGCTSTTRAGWRWPTSSRRWRPARAQFDGSIGGLGGCPYAPGASGNVATEDMVGDDARMGIEHRDRGSGAAGGGLAGRGDHRPAAGRAR